MSKRMSADHIEADDDCMSAYERNRHVADTGRWFEIGNKADSHNRLMDIGWRGN